MINSILDRVSFLLHVSMNEANLASVVLGIVAGFYTTIFLLCLSDVVYLSKEMTKMKIELADIRRISFNQSSTLNKSPIPTMIFNRTTLPPSPTFQKMIKGKLCFSYTEQRQILDYINFLCNIAILLCGSYSIYTHGLGTHHGLAYRLIFFLVKVVTIIASIILNLHFKQGLPHDIFLYIWIDLNCIGSIYRSLRQSI